jgi:hypothetical protein
LLYIDRASQKSNTRHSANELEIPMKFQRLLPLALFLGFLIGCNEAKSPDIALPEMTIGPEYLFDVYYVNFAWGYQMRGTYIDNCGNVVSYDHSFARWLPEDSRSLTPEELNDKFSSPVDTVGAVDMAVLWEMFNKIEAASMGESSERECPGRDGGATTYICYRYDEDTERFNRVLLSTYGDCIQTNLSTEAVELYNWLRSVRFGGQ